MTAGNKTAFAGYPLPSILTSHKLFKFWILGKTGFIGCPYKYCNSLCVLRARQDGYQNSATSVILKILPLYWDINEEYLKPEVNLTDWILTFVNYKSGWTFNTWLELSLNVSFEAAVNRYWQKVLTLVANKETAGFIFTSK